VTDPANSSETPRGEAWLRTNRRALALGMAVPGLVLVAAGGGLTWSIVTGQHPGWQLLLMLLAAIPLWMIGELLYALAHPRIGYHAGHLLVYLEPTRPTRVPIEIVECFFLGQGGSELPKLRGREPETKNVVIRLAESATDWKHRDVRPAFGHWCEGYITIRGAWCEPITERLLKHLNQRLVEVHRQRKAAAQEALG
jgi:hypothetical protein